MSLQEQLEQVVIEANKRYPEEFFKTNWNEILTLKNNANGLKIGDKAPDFTLPDALGKEIQLSKMLAKGPVVLSFYRGSWCPFCNLELRELHKNHDAIKDLGASLIAVSPEKPDHSFSLVEKENLSFPVLSDITGEVMRKYHLIWEFSDEMRNQFLKHLNLDLKKSNDAGWVLPIPGTFVIDSQAMVRDLYVDEDFTKRMEPVQILDALKALS